MCVMLFHVTYYRMCLCALIQYIFMYYIESNFLFFLSVCLFVQMVESMKAVPEEQRKVIAEAASVHRDQLRQRLLDDTTAVSQCVLRDFDWQLKVNTTSGSERDIDL